MLSVQDLYFSVQESSILNGVSLEVQEGEIVGVIGPNGSGKTTLFNCLSGFHRPQRGQIIFNERDITKLPPAKRAHIGIGRVFQNFGIFREMTVLENLILAIESRKPLHKALLPFSRDDKRNRERAMEFLADIKLEDKANDKAGSLSGGQMRLLEIVRCLALEAEIFLLDEPTAGVSPKMKAEVAALIARLKAAKKTVLIIEHDIRFIQSFCERIAVLDTGRVILDGPTEEIGSSEKLQEIYFGTKENESAQI